MSAAAELGAFVTKEEARRLKANLGLGHGLMHQAVGGILPSRRTQIQELLEAVLAELGGDVGALGVVLDALSGVPQAARPQLVWTSPSLPNSEGHTTLAVSALINEAQTYVYAATYSAGLGSAYVTALRKALGARGEGHRSSSTARSRGRSPRRSLRNWTVLGSGRCASQWPVSGRCSTPSWS